MAGADCLPSRDQGYDRISWSQFQGKGTAVCRIKRTKKVASGFIGRLSDHGNLIVLITNSHVLQTKQQALEASVTFGYVDKDNQGISKKGEEIFDTTMWRTETDREGDKYGLDYTLVKIKEDVAKEDYMKSIQPFDLTPTPLYKNDRLFIIQYPDDPDDPQLELSASSCKKVIGSLAFYDSSTSNGSSGSPVVKVVNGKLQVVALHRFRTVNEKCRAGSIFIEILRHTCFIDGDVTETTKEMVDQHIKPVKWKKLEIRDLQKSLARVSSQWKELAHCLNVKDVAAIEMDCHYKSASDEALKEVVARWLKRTTTSKRTWKTLCDAAIEENDHTLQKYIKDEHLLDNDEPEMRDVVIWSKKSSLRDFGWYNLATNLINLDEAIAIEAKYTGGGSKKCLQKVLEKWVRNNPHQNCTWGVIVAALEEMEETEIVDEITETQTL